MSTSPPELPFSAAWLRRSDGRDLLAALNAHSDISRTFLPTLWTCLQPAPFSLIDADGVLVFNVNCTAQCLNLHKHMSGASISALVDEIAVLTAALKLGPNRVAATTHLSVHFLSPIRQGPFKIQSEIIGRSFSQAYIRVSMSLEDGVRAAEGHVTIGLRQWKQF